MYDYLTSFFHRLVTLRIGQSNVSLIEPRIGKVLGRFLMNSKQVAFYEIRVLLLNIIIAASAKS